jgi:hypothetical protein
MTSETTEPAVQCLDDGDEFFDETLAAYIDDESTKPPCISPKSWKTVAPREETDRRCAVGQGAKDPHQATNRAVEQAKAAGTQANSDSGSSGELKQMDGEQAAKALDEQLAANMEGTDPEPDGVSMFDVVDGGFAYQAKRKNKDGETESYLKRFTNFTARIEEVHYIDSDFINSEGILVTATKYVLSGELDGKALRPISFPSDHLSTRHKMLAQWPGTTVEPHQKNSDEMLRNAIIEHSQPLKEVHRYRFTGWKEFDGQWTYLHAGGGIDAGGLRPDIKTSLPDRLELVNLPEPLTEDGAAMRAAATAVLRLLDVAPDRVMVPLVAASHRAITASLLSLEYSVFLNGLTGVLKTSLADVFQTFWTPGHRGERLQSWSSSANSIEKTVFLAKDMLLLIDEYKPGGEKTDRSEMQRSAKRIFQNVGNSAGRQRDTASGEDRQTRWPRAMVLATGEEAPPTESTQARLILLSLSPGDVDTAVLTEAQKAADSGLFASYLATFIRSIASQYENLASGKLKDDYEKLRVKARKHEFAHPRFPDTVASLALGWNMFASFIEGAGVLTKTEAEALRRRGWNGLVEAVTVQGQAQREEQPAVLFMTYLRSAIASGLAHLTNAGGSEPQFPERWGWRMEPRGDDDEVWRPQGRAVGWTDNTGLNGGFVYIDPTAAYGIVGRVAQGEGGAFPVTKRALLSALDDSGLLARKDKGRCTVKEFWREKRSRMLCLKQKDFISPE